MTALYLLADAPLEFQIAVQEFWPPEQFDAAASISFLESRWNPFAVRDTRDPQHPCGAQLGSVDGVAISAEYSIGWFQLNACNFSDWTPAHFFNTRHNCGTAHMLWSERGWRPWYFSAKALGLL